MLGILNQIRENIGMDANYFYPALLTIILPAFSLIYGLVKNNIKNNLLDFQTKEESGIFYGIVMFIEVLVIGVEIEMHDLVWRVIGAFLHSINIHIYVPVFINDIMSIMFVVLMGIILTKKLSKTVFIRNRVIGSGKERYLLYAPIIIMHIWAIVIIFNIKNTILMHLLCITIICFEIIGIFVFDGRYIKYKYSSVRITMNDGEVLDCKDISKISKKYNYLIVMQDDKQIRMRYDYISKTEYYGEPLFVMKESEFKKRGLCLYKKILIFVQKLFHKQNK